MSDVVLRLSDITKRVQLGESTLEILKGVSLTLRAGEFVAVMGASGSGKSTLLNMIGLLDPPSSGSIQLMGQEIAGLGEDRLASLRARSRNASRRVVRTMSAVRT